jgi:hypothetical protein
LDQFKQFNGLFDAPGALVSGTSMMTTHLLPFVFDVFGGAAEPVLKIITRKLFVDCDSNFFPYMTVFHDLLPKEFFLFLTPFASIVVRVELSATKIVTRLHTPLGQTLGYLAPCASQLFRQLFFRLRAKPNEIILI